jgi:hypothetical protein
MLRLTRPADASTMFRKSARPEAFVPRVSSGATAGAYLVVPVLSIHAASVAYERLGVG